MPYTPTGIIPPLPTPLRSHDELDHAGLSRLLEHVIAGGVDGVFLMGTTGEGPSLSERLKVQLTDAACELVAGRTPVLIGITHTSYAESLALAETAEASGATALVAAAPYYSPMSDLELRRYFERLADELPLPLVLYNMPSCVKVSLPADLVADLAAHENVVGIKDSSGSMEELRSLLDASGGPEQCPLLVGPERLICDAMRLGAIGGVSAGANLFPNLFRDLIDAANRTEWDAAERLQAEVVALGEMVYDRSPHPSRVIVGVKSALEAMGICDAVTTVYREPLDDRTKAELRRDIDAAIAYHRTT